MGSEMCIRDRNHFQHSLRIAEQLHNDNPNSAQAARDLSVSLEKLSTWYAGQETQETNDRALELQQQALTLAEELLHNSGGASFYARTAAVSCWLCATRANSCGNDKLANNYTGKCFKILQQMHETQMPLGDLQSLYEHLNNSLNG